MKTPLNREVAEIAKKDPYFSKFRYFKPKAKGYSFLFSRASRLRGKICSSY